MNKITVLCMSCNTPLLETAPERLGWPMTGTMFTMLVHNIYMRDMPLSLDIFCPVCLNYPFYHDGSSNGFKGVGRYLNIMGEDGKPRMVSIDELSRVPAIVPKPPPQAPKVNIPATKKKTTKGKPGRPGIPKTPKDLKTRPDPILADLEARVSKGAPKVALNAPPTAEEIAELQQDRAAQYEGGDKDQTRPAYELGYHPK